MGQPRMKAFPRSADQYLVTVMDAMQWNPMQVVDAMRHLLAVRRWHLRVHRRVAHLQLPAAARGLQPAPAALHLRHGDHLEHR